MTDPNQTVSEQELDEIIARAFGRNAYPTSAINQFRDAGFCEEDARRGVELLASGIYSGFTEVAETMLLDPFDNGAFRIRNPEVTPGRIEDSAAAASRSTESAAVTELIEAVVSGDSHRARLIAFDLREDA